MKNIYLTGMPGCGKSTVGKILAQSISCPFLDLDEVITKLCETSINNIFEKNGESFFRLLENSVLREISRLESCVISTGGGIIKDPRNIDILNCGTVVFIDTDVDTILQRTDFSDRPLLKDNHENLKKLYEERYSIYKSCASITVSGQDSASRIAANILSLI